MSEQSNERELFEKWARLNEHDASKRPLDDDYFYHSTRLAWRAWKAARAPLLARIAELEAQVAFYKEVSINRAWQVRELDLLLNGAGAAQQASLCDVISQVRKEGIRSASYIEIDAARRRNE